MLVLGAVALHMARIPSHPAVLACDVTSALAASARRAAPHAVDVLRKHWLTVAAIVPAVLTAARTWPVARLTAFPQPVQAVPRVWRLAAREIANEGSLPTSRHVPIVEQGLVSHRRELTLPAEPTAPRHARALLRAAATEWEVDEDIYEDAAMIVTELVANAVDHARSSSTLTIDLDDHGLHVAVRDTCLTGVPRLAPADPHAPRGRGLQMVDALSTNWGVTRHGDGKTVWAVLATN
jgi:anti-sigma regulatory factor (Ser/Thr protein kinase)